MHDHDKLLQQFKETQKYYEANHAKLAAQFKAVTYDHKESSKKSKSMIDKAVPAATAAAVAALIMAPSIVAATPPGEVLPVQIQTENSAIEQPEQNRPVEQPEQNRPVEQPEQNRPVEQPEQNRPVEQPEQNRPVEQPEQNRPVEQPEQNRPVEQPEQNRPVEQPEQNRPVEQPEQNRPVEQPEQNRPVEQPAPANREKQFVPQDNPPSAKNFSPSKETKETFSAQSLASNQDAESKSTESIKVEGKLPDTASPYPMQMLVSGLVSLSGIAGLILSRKKR